MRAMVCTELSGPAGLRLLDQPEPEPGACHVRVAVAAAGVNFADTLMITGRYQERQTPPFIPGLELAGRIDALGAAVSGFEVGQRVLAVVDRGAYAQSAVARMDDVVPLPDAIDDVTAAGFAIAYGTAYGALVWRAQLHAGETLLVHGAAGGVGLTAVECGKVLGARVIATARGAEKLEVARAHGAELAFDSEDPELVGKLKEAAGPQGVDVVFDPVGGAMFDASLKTIAWEGRIVIVGFAGGGVPQIPANRLLVKNAGALGFYWGSYRRHDPERLRASFEALFDWYAAGRLRPLISNVVPLARAADALELMIARRSTGKVVLDVAG